MEQVLIGEEKYDGYYVTIEDFDKPVVISYGKDPQKVYEDTVNRGYPEPVIIFVPDREAVQIY